MVNSSKRHVFRRLAYGGLIGIAIGVIAGCGGAEQKSPAPTSDKSSSDGTDGSGSKGNESSGDGSGSR